MGGRTENYGDLNEALDDFGRTFDAFKTANDEALEKKAGREAFADVEEKVERVGDAIGKAEEKVRRLENEFESERARVENLEAIIATNGGGKNKDILLKHKDAFLHFLASGGRGGALDRLLETQQKYIAMQPESKQINLASAAAGEALVPEIIDSTIETMEQKNSPVRRLISPVSVMSTDYKQVVDIRGTASGWLAETGTRAVTDSPTLRVRTPTWGELYARPQATEWAAMDIPNMENWLAQSVSDEFIRAEGIAVINGNGTNRPTGILNTTPVTTDDEASPLRSAEALESIAAPSPDDITEHMLSLIYALQPGYRAGAAWAMNSVTLGLVRRAKDSNGQYLWQPSFQSGQPSQIAGYNFEVWENMPNVGLSPLNYPIAFGNWNRGYLLAERTGVRVLVDPYTTIGLISWWFRRREGGIILNNDAIKLAQR